MLTTSCSLENDIPTLVKVKQWLGKCFAMKDLGETETILGIKIYKDRSLQLLGLSQEKYIDKILKRFSMANFKKGFIPLQQGVVLSKKDSLYTFVNGYFDADFQTDIEDSKSQSGYVFCLNGGVVSWKSSKQDTITDSTTESEYIVASEAAKEAV